MNNRIRLALIGCGAVAKIHHLPAIARVEAVELAALVDPSLERARELAQQYGVGESLKSDPSRARAEKPREQTRRKLKDFGSQPKDFSMFAGSRRLFASFPPRREPRLFRAQSKKLDAGQDVECSE